MDGDVLTETTTLLRRLQEGDRDASGELFSLLYSQLHGLAQNVMRSGRKDHTLQPTALVNEIWLRLSDGDGLAVENRKHFMRIAARAMRGVLVDHARRRAAQKRRGDADRVPLDDALLAWENDETVSPIILSEALDRLRRKDERLAEVVDLRFFAGLTIEETAEVLDLTRRQVQHSWKLARGWLMREIERDGLEAG